MAEAAVPYGRVTQKKPAVSDVHIVWITAGLGCDGDSVSITAATQPSIEDVVLGAIPGFPKCTCTILFLPTRTVKTFYVLFIRRKKASSIHSSWWWKAQFRTRTSRRKAIGRRWGRTRRRDSLSRPMNGSTDWHRRRCSGCHRDLRDLWRDSRHAGKSDRVHGSGGLSGLGLAVEGRLADRECSGVSGAAGQLYGDRALSALPSGGVGADDSAGRSASSHLAVWQHRP